MPKQNKKPITLESITYQIIQAIGTPQSIVLHSIFFVGIFLLRFIGISTSDILLILTTVVSLEAIYMAIFIQMTVNRQSASLKSVEEDIDEIQEDVEDLQEGIEDIQVDFSDDDAVDQKTHTKLEKIESGLQVLLAQVEELKKIKN